MDRPFELTADNIINYANNNGLTLTRGTSVRYPTVCVRGVIAHAADVHPACQTTIAETFNVTYDNLERLEEGFEGWEPYDPNNQYYKVGLEVAKKTKPKYINRD